MSRSCVNPPYLSFDVARCMSRAFYGLSIAVLKSGSCRVKVVLVVRLVDPFLEDGEVRVKTRELACLSF